MSTLLKCALTALLSLLAWEVHARDLGQYSHIDPQIKTWVEGLKNQEGVGCCATADGFPAEAEWDMEGNHYRVRIDGEWQDVPPQAVISEPNRLGHATVWYWYRDGKPQIRCFLPGSGS
jgi:hypothetical protein